VRQYIAIWNKGQLTREYVEYTGLSTKKGEDTGRIGFKGSGTNLAAIAAVRRDMSAAVSSTDAKGRFYLRFDAEDVEIVHKGRSRTVKELVYRYWKLVDDRPVEAEVLRTKHVIDGFADWDGPIGCDGNKEFKIVREHVCNAFDEDQDFKVTVVNEHELVFAPPGETVVYLRFTEGVRKIFDSWDRYFKFSLRDAAPHVRVDGIGTIWTKSEKGVNRMFIRGVLAGCSMHEYDRCLFDYSLDDRSLLSEERILKSEYEYKTQVGKLLLGLTDDGLIGKIVEHIHGGKTPYEIDALASVHRDDTTFRSGCERWRRAFGAFYAPNGGQIAVHSSVPYADAEAAQLYGFVVVGAGNPRLCQFLRHLGFPSTESVVPKEFQDKIEQVPFSALSFSGKEKFRLAFAYHAKHLPDYAAIPIAFFRAKREDDEKIRCIAGFCGFGERRFKEIWIKVDADGNLPGDGESPGDVNRTLAHESWHCVSQAGDHERAFVAVADKDIVMAILRHEREPLFDPKTPVRGWGDPDAKPRFVPMPEGVIHLGLEDLEFDVKTDEHVVDTTKRKP